MPHITVRDENNETKDYPLDEESNLTFGRSKDCDMPFETDPKISKKHCRLYFHPTHEQFVISDLNSTNGTILNFNRIATDIILSDNDKIQIGNVRILFKDSEYKSTITTKTRKVLKRESKKRVNLGLEDHTDTIIIPNYKILEEQAKEAEKEKKKAEAKPKPKIEDNIGEYELLDKLTESSFYRSFKARHEITSDEVVVRCYNPTFKDNDPAIAEFYQNLSKLKQINNPYFIPVLDNGVDKGHCFYTTEFFESGDLYSKIAETAPFPEYDALCIIYTIASALDTAYSQHRTIHGDLCPSNILINEKNSLLLKGQGMYTWATAHCGENQLAASDWYISPEQIKQKMYDWNTDLYSLGIIFFQLLTGKVPFNANSSEGTYDLHLQEPLPDPRKYNPNIWISGATASILHKMTAKEPAARYSSWKMFLEIVEWASEQLDETE